MDTRPGDSTALPAAKRRRSPRAVLACERCRLKKYKCSEAQPCAHCKRSGAECEYGRGYRPPLGRESLASGIEQLGPIEEELNARSRPNAPIIKTKSHPAGQPLPSTGGGSHLPAPSPSEESEIAEVNQHTNGIEYHGNTSSMSFLDSLQKIRAQRKTQPNPSERCSFSLVSTLHNPSFISRRDFTSSLTAVLAAGGFYSKRAHSFIEGYFGGIHYVHPIIDKEDFLARAGGLWRGAGGGDVHFVALYLSVLSLGALTRTWDSRELDGMTRFQWSRKLFAEAQALLDEIQFTSVLETIQCFYVMAKICQNELNPNLAYMYLGWAIRSCLAAGFNRETPTPNTRNGSSMSRIWWGLYSLEIEMSFLLGRPDTLGQDEYHNRAMPPADDSEHAIIPAMVQLGRIMRRVSIGVYHSRLPAPETVRLASEISREMDAWHNNLPQRRRNSLREPDWRRKQRLVLELRYHNVKMLLFRPFITQGAPKDGARPEELVAAVSECISSAQKTVEIVYEAYKVHTYFQTWWYNTTYVTIAASVLLLYESQAGGPAGSNMPLIETAVEILEAMDESVVARSAAEVIRHFARELSAGPPAGSARDAVLGAGAQEAATPGPWAPLEQSGLSALDFFDFPLGEMTGGFDELQKGLGLEHGAADLNGGL